MASLNPRTSYGLGFSSWSLRILAGYIIYDSKLIDRISHSAEISNILLEHGTKWRRKSKIVLSNKSASLHDSKYGQRYASFITKLTKL